MLGYGTYCHLHSLCDLKICNLNILLLTAVLLFTTGCSTIGAQHRPVVDGDDLVNYETDLQQCQSLAKQTDFINNDAKSNAMLGGLVGALVGIGESKESSLAGALLGATIGAASNAYTIQQERKNRVIHCMQGKGYNVKSSD